MDRLERLKEVARELPFPAQLSVSYADPLDQEVRIRMLLLLLVDADRLDTEARGFEGLTLRTSGSDSKRISRS